MAGNLLILNDWLTRAGDFQIAAFAGRCAGVAAFARTRAAAPSRPKLPFPRVLRARGYRHAFTRTPA
jgi:hypothetical protein